jgi:hypothetical protein
MAQKEAFLLTDRPPRKVAEEDSRPDAGPAAERKVPEIKSMQS